MLKARLHEMGEVHGGEVKSARTGFTAPQRFRYKDQRSRDENYR